MDIMTNYPFWAATVGMVIAQVLKIPIRWLLTKEFIPNLVLSSGGMPSSHSSSVSALATAIALTEGLGSTLFAAVCVFSVIIMYDSSGVRRQSGNQAILLNQLVRDFQAFTSRTKGTGHEYEKLNTIKEILGHEPIEVFFGALLGISIAFLLYGVY